MEQLTAANFVTEEKFVNHDTSRRKSLLMIFLDPPSPPPLDLSSTKRNLPFMLENLKRYKVSVLALGNEEEEARFKQEYGSMCESIRFVNIRGTKIGRLMRHVWLGILGLSQTRCRAHGRKMQQVIDQTIRENHFDLIHCTSSLLGFYRFPENIPVVGDTHNVEFDLIERMYKTTRHPFLKLYTFFEHMRLKKEELKICRKFDAMVATTERDRNVWIENSPSLNVTVVENGVDKIFFDGPKNTEMEPNSMIFVGFMEYYPNHHGVRYFMDEIFPMILRERPDAKLYVVGTRPTADVLAYTSEHIEITGYVKDIRPYVARCKVFVIPLLIGGGIRGKALEAMAMRIPIVSTTIGVEGIKLVKDESVLLADTPSDFAASVVRLLDDAKLRDAIVDKAYRSVVANYDWPAKGIKLDQLYQRVINNRKNKKTAEISRGVTR